MASWYSNTEYTLLYYSSSGVLVCVLLFLQAFEPSEIERGFFTDQDNEIRVTDMPERFQLRQVPVKPTEEGEIEEESEWIYKQAFSTPPISQQVGGSKSLWALVIVKTPIWFNVFHGIWKMFFIHLFT